MLKRIGGNPGRMVGRQLRGGISKETALEKELEVQLKEYFSGKEVCFNYPLDLAGYSQFQRKVWRIVQTIPYGELRSYRWVAERLGNPGSARAVGQALKVNPVPVIVACHRIVCSNGSLGGFSAGEAWKRGLQRLERNLVT